MDPSHPTPAQRAADSDREAAAELLRTAGGDGRLSLEEMEDRLTAVYSARTHPELDALLADLTGHRALTPHPPWHASAHQASQSFSGPVTERTVSIMGESSRRGRWRPAAASRVLTVMGETTIDLTEADLSRQVTRMRVLTVMGKATIEVPDHVNVHVTKTTIMAQNDIEVGPASIPGAPELHIHLVSVMGEATLRVRRRGGRLTELYA